MLKVEGDNTDKDFRGATVYYMPAIPAVSPSVNENIQIIGRWKLKIMAKGFL